VEGTCRHGDQERSADAAALQCFRPGCGSRRLAAAAPARCGCACSLRLRLLELDGQLLAGDLSCVFENTEFLVKTGYDERFSRLSPGLVLRAEALRAAIDEGLSRYDFLGGPDPYKVRWGAVLRPRLMLDAYRRRGVQCCGGGAAARCCGWSATW
jgi:CelD/BcsL family acetyltransferase involved in cellulose biosynthesis